MKYTERCPECGQWGFTGKTCLRCGYERKRVSRHALIALAVLLLSACAPAAKIESKPVQVGDKVMFSCESQLNRGWLTEQETDDFKSGCDPTTGKVTLDIGAHGQKTQTDAIKAISEGIAAGMTKALVPGAAGTGSAPIKVN